MPTGTGRGRSRSAAPISTHRAAGRLFAGCGIVVDSDPAAELAETQAKFQAMLSALVRP
ncbi:MAG: chorismate-binding protein [Ilumatobacteraceae bacterium]